MELRNAIHTVFKSIPIEQRAGMKFWMFLAFVVAIASFGWWVKAVEHMTETNPIYGPKIVNKEKCQKEYPTLYGANTYLIDGTLGKELPAIPTDNKQAGQTVVDTQTGTFSAWDQDDGTVSSDTATTNPMFSQIFTFNPHFQVSFPVSGPPQPYLTDFSKMHS